MPAPVDQNAQRLFAKLGGVEIVFEGARVEDRRGLPAVRQRSHDRQPRAAVIQMNLEPLPLRIRQDGLDDGSGRLFLPAKNLRSAGIADDYRNEIAARLKKAPHRVFRRGRGWIVLDFRRRGHSVDQRLPRRNGAADPVRTGVRRQRMRLQHLRRHGLAIEIGEAKRNKRKRYQPRRRERNDDASKKADLQPPARLGCIGWTHESANGIAATGHRLLMMCNAARFPAPSSFEHNPTTKKRGLAAAMG
jgi:hypothetical protein